MVCLWECSMHALNVLHRRLLGLVGLLCSSCLLFACVLLATCTYYWKWGVSQLLFVELFSFLSVFTSCIWGSVVRYTYVYNYLLHGQLFLSLLYNETSLSLVTIFVLRSILCSISIAIPAFSAIFGYCLRVFPSFYCNLCLWISSVSHVDSV